MAKPNRKRDPRKGKTAKVTYNSIRKKKPASTRSIEILNAAAMWMDIFNDVLLHLMDGEASRAVNVDQVETALLVADEALNAVQRRWPTVPL